MPSRFHIPLLMILGGWLFTLNLGGYALWAPDEPRFAQVSREMMQSGDYLTPYINGEPYLEKPPLFFWMISAVSKPFGDVTELSARIPSVLGALLTLLLTYLVARRMYGAEVALWSGLILLTTQRFWWQARFAQIDMVLTACLMVAFYCFWVWHTERRSRYLVGMYAAVAAGVLAKGPPALIFPLLAAICFYWGRKDDRRKLHLVIGLLSAAGVALLWLIPARAAIAPAEAGAHAQIGGDLYRQIIGRFFLGVSKDQPFYYYFVNLPADLFPWTLLLPWSILWVWRKRRDGEPMRFLLSWTLPAILFFSLSAGKRAIYLLPIFPAIAILMARSLLDLMQGDWAHWRRPMAWTWVITLIIVSLAPWAVLFTEYADSWSNWFIAGSLAGVGFAIQSAWGAKRDSAKTLPRNIVVHFTVLLSLMVMFVFPAINEHKSAKDFCAPLRVLSERNVEYDLYSYGFSREEYIYYAKHFHTHWLGSPVAYDAMPQSQAEALNDAFKSAIETFDVDDRLSFTDAEMTQLDAAFEAAYESAGLSPEASAAHQAAVRSSLDSTLALFDTDSPVFMILRAAEWVRMVAFHPETSELTVVVNEKVGSRHVVLLTNAAGQSAIASAAPTDASQTVGESED